MSQVLELKKHAKQLQSSGASEKELTTILHILKKDYQVNEAVLRESRVGLAVGKLRTHASKDVSDLAKDIVKKWKNDVEKAKQSHQSGGSSKPVQNGKPAPGRKASVASDGKPTMQTAAKAATRSAKTDGFSDNSLTGDSTRNKCIALIYDSLAFDSDAPSDLILRRAQAVEKEVYNLFFGNSNTEYRGKIRSLFVNLKDKSNPSLREGVISGDVPAEKLATMTSEEMASEERKAADSKIRDQNLFQSLSAEEQQAETEAFQCGRCKQRKCRYRQAQTRSADEPMTTFVTCVNCGNRWKFS
ncbi:transcription elongation factor [Guyanagaster necrorhizus]|uniref:Transcription elongation factor n=1 Tax=Guyanagaster necrorhizus TaxID=856835 RepID=A0A9P7VG63_9AGAR|nr:transcription elongation factor [Guyanagaster necrorhizus MCA 3950]KAG7440094.1 transcription elongation factor [Guyanagaster necrorhizus MCA 3950]